MRIASLIVHRFPTETLETYYVKNKKKRARGKLYDQFQHYRASLMKAGLASKRGRRQVTLGTNDTEGNSSQSGSDIGSGNEDNQDPAVLLTYLEAHGGPWPDVVRAWNQTHTERSDVLKRVTTVEYFRKYPALLTNKGLELVTSTQAESIKSSCNISVIFLLVGCRCRFFTSQHTTCDSCFGTSQ